MEQRSRKDNDEYMWNHIQKKNWDKPVGFKEMIQQQRYLWPIDCPDELTDVPRCWNASLNLGNEKHNDYDGTRSFAVWVSNNKESSETSWYFIFSGMGGCNRVMSWNMYLMEW
jgi:hypothetical protein